MAPRRHPPVFPLACVRTHAQEVGESLALGPPGLGGLRAAVDVHALVDLDQRAVLAAEGDRGGRLARPLALQRFVAIPTGPFLPETMCSVNFVIGASGIVSKLVASRVPPGILTLPVRSSAT